MGNMKAVSRKMWKIWKLFRGKCGKYGSCFEENVENMEAVSEIFFNLFVSQNKNIQKYIYIFISS